MSLSQVACNAIGIVTVFLGGMRAMDRYRQQAAFLFFLGCFLIMVAHV